MRAILAFFILSGPLFLVAEEFSERSTYYSVPREVVNEYREVDGKVYNLGKRKTWETYQSKSDIRTKALIKNSKPPLPKWRFFTMGLFDEVFDKDEEGILIWLPGGKRTRSNGGRTYYTDETVRGYIKNHPNHKEIAAGDRIACWAMDTGETIDTVFGPVKIYDYGKKVEAPNSTPPQESKPAADPTK